MRLDGVDLAAGRGASWVATCGGAAWQQRHGGSAGMVVLLARRPAWVGHCGVAICAACEDAGVVSLLWRCDTCSNDDGGEESWFVA